MKKIVNEGDFRRRMRQLIEYRINNYQEQEEEFSDDDTLIDELMAEDDEDPNDEASQQAAPKDPKATEKAPAKPQPAAKPDGGAPKEPAPKPAPAPEASVEEPEGEMAPADEPAPEPTPEETVEPVIDKEEAEQSQKLERMEGMFALMMQKLEQMGAGVEQINQLQQQISDLKKGVDEVRPATEQEMFDNIALQSYPYNLKLSDVFAKYMQQEAPPSDLQKEYSFTEQDAIDQISDADVEQSFFGEKQMSQRRTY